MLAVGIKEVDSITLTDRYSCPSIISLDRTSTAF